MGEVIAEVVAVDVAHQEDEVLLADVVELAQRVEQRPLSYVQTAHP